MKEKSFKNNKKILMYEKHIAWIENEMLEKLNIILKNKKISRHNWIKEQCMQDFSLELTNKESIANLDIIVKKNMYNDKAEWLREKIREEIKSY